MRRSVPFIALLAAPVLLLSSAALADPCGDVALASSGNCEFRVSGGCEADCQPLNLTAACDGQCDATFQASCTNPCEIDCQAKCDPGSIDCYGTCTGSCSAACDTYCSDSACFTDCNASCNNRCEIDCHVEPPSCEASCQVACNTTCTVQANVGCHMDCTATLEGGCKAQCQTPKGALFCNGQYVDAVDSVDACLDYLRTRGFGVAVTCNGSGCSASLGCSVAPQVGAADDRLAAGGVAGLLAAVGLFAARRRRAQR